MNQGDGDVLKRLTQFFDKYKLVLLMLVVGIALLLWPQPSTNDPVETEMFQAENEMEFNLEELERRMEQTLSQIEGAGEVSVLLTLKSGTEQVYAADRERREDSGDTQETTSTVVISTGSGTETAVVIRQNYPAFQGALVVCGGGDNPEVQLLVTQAVAALTGLGADKITVCK